jgi:hypothetical protein
MVSNYGHYETIFTILIHAQEGENSFARSCVIANRKRGSATTQHKATKLKTQPILTYEICEAKLVTPRSDMNSDATVGSAATGSPRNL